MNVELPMCLIDWIDTNDINWHWLSENNSQGAIQLFKKYPEKIDWDWLSRNPSEGAMRLLEKNPDKINWDWLSRNPSEGAMRLLEKNQDKINWSTLSGNESDGAMYLLEKNQDRINWSYLCVNPHIFKYDYKQMKISCMLFKEDLIKNRFHPRNIPKFKDWGVYGFE